MFPSIGLARSVAREKKTLKWLKSELQDQALT
jgi:hypothetical protein